MERGDEITTLEKQFSMSSNSKSSAHILVFPFPALGHMLPLLDLTHHLVIHGLTITILVTPKNLSILKPLLSKHPSIQTLILPFPNYPSIPFGVENTKDLPLSYFPSMIHALGELYHPIIQWSQTHPSPPQAILSDLLLGWTQHLACQLGIPRIIFSPVGAIFVSVYNCLWRDLPKQMDNTNGLSLPISFPEIPNSPAFPWYQISPIYRSYVKEDPVSEFLRDSMLANISSWGIVFNSFRELEGSYLDHLRKDFGHDRVWALGPVLPLDTENSILPMERGGPNSTCVEEVISWLDSCEDNSVVYVCFGSQIGLKTRQMEELAAGLEISGARFIWCVKEKIEGLQSPDGHGLVPTGFIERVRKRGLIIKGWAPQVTILRHRAVASYLTHCGWNSMLEGLIAGVQLLLWPMGADHFTNARILVDELRVAIRVCEGADAVPNSVALARVLAESVNENSSMKVRAMELRRAALAGIKEGGRSYKNLDEFVKSLCSLIGS